MRSLICCLLSCGALFITFGLVLSCAGAGKSEDEDAGSGAATWIDSVSGLEWQAGQSDDYMMWADAETYCMNLNLGGYADWRLPTITELRTLVHGCEETQTGGSCNVTEDCAEPSCWDDTCSGCKSGDGPSNGCYGPSELSGCSWSWSSSFVGADNDSVWGVSLDNGGVSYMIVEPADGGYYVRCVR